MFEIARYKADKLMLITPDKLELLNGQLHSCTVKDCPSKFPNVGNLNMHLLKHHKLEIPKDHSIKRFYCPEQPCVYNLVTESDKFFNSFKSLKQHYVKVHSERNHKCGTCDKSFPTENYLKHHEKVCGKKFICEICKYEYTSREAILTHARRKNHKYIELLSQNKNILKIKKPKEFLKKQVIAEKPPMVIILRYDPQPVCNPAPIQTGYLEDNKQARNNQTTQTFTTKVKTTPKDVTNNSSTQTFPNFYDSDMENCNLVDNSSQTNLNSINFIEDSLSCFDTAEFDEADPILCNNETQTDHINSMFSNFDSLLHSHMYTQTCNEILTELGLTNIETQTNWGSDGYNNYLHVSTETQTNLNGSFPEDDINNSTNSSIQTQTSKSMEFLDNISCENTSIQTQTS